MVGVIGYSSSLLPLRRKGKQHIGITWLSTNKCLETLSEKVEALIGSPRKRAWPVMRELVEGCMETIRERDILLHSLTDFYKFVTKDSFAFAYPLKGRRVPWIKSLPELRVEVFSRRFGYAFDEGIKAIKEVVSGEQWQDNEASEKLWADHSHYEILQRVRERPSSEQLIGLANFYSLVVLCRFCVEVRVEIEGSIHGSVAKAVIYVAKRNGIFVELIRENEKVIAKILPGNRELGSTSQQNALSRVIGVLIRELMRNGAKFVMTALVQHPQFKNLKKFKVDFAELEANLVKKGVESITRKALVADSEEERALFEQIRKNAQGWKIHDDPEIVFLDNTIYVPDFVAQQDNRKVLIELAGFYTEKYLEKKAEKLKEVAKKHALIVLVPENNRHVFENLSCPVLTYQKRPSWQRLLRVLENSFSQIEQESNLQAKLLRIITENEKKKDCFSTEELQQSLGISRNTFDKWLFSKETREVFRKHGYVVISPVGLMKQETWEKIGQAFDSLFDSGIIEISEYRKVLPLATPSEWVSALLQTHGFDVSYENFTSLKVRKKHKTTKRERFS